MLAPPSIARAGNGNLTIVYGTGSADDAASDTRRHVVYSLSEVYAAGSSTPTAKRNWVKTLQSQERFVGPPVIFANQAYFATYSVQQAGQCAVGSARLWGARFERPQAVSDPTDLQGAFANPAQPAKLSANLDFLEVGAYKPSPVDIQPVPGCQGSCPPTDAKCVATQGGALGGGKPSYEIGVSVAGKVQGKSQAPKAGPEPAVGTITREIPQPRSAAMVTGWDLLLD